MGEALEATLDAIHRVRRERDPADGRAVVVTLQPSGATVIRHLRRQGRATLDRLVAHWPQRDQDDLATLLLRLGVELEKPATRPDER